MILFAPDLLPAWRGRGGNITGLSALSAELSGKRLELLRQAVPKLSRVAVLWNATNPLPGVLLRETEAAARMLGVQVQPLAAQGPDDFERAFSAMTRGRADGLIVVPDMMFFENRGRLVELAARSRLPAMSGIRVFVDAGGLISYAASLPDLSRRAASYVDKILKGTKPADLPVEQSTKFELVINGKTAKELGITIPPTLLARADEVIE